MSSGIIPSFYRVVFAWIDPMFCCLGIFNHFFAKNDVVAGLAPAAIVPPRPETVLLLDYQLGFFAMLCCMQIGLTRLRPNDVAVWKVLQFSTLVLDIVQVATTVNQVVSQGRAAPGVWLSGEWQNIGGNTGIGLIRAAFVLGIGLSGAKGKSA